MPKENVPLREDYRFANPDCELFPLLVQINAMLDCRPASHYRRPAAEHVHHIWGGPNRYDLTGNLICLSRMSHDWAHQNPVDGKVLCHAVKARKGEAEFDVLSEVFQQNVLGWLENKLDVVSPLVRPFAVEILEGSK